MRILLRHRLLTALFVAFSVLYVVQSSVLSQDRMALQRYNLSDAQGALLSLTVALPYIIIWFIALVGYLRLKTYARTIADSKDGAAFNLICAGLLGLTVWLPLS